MLCQRLIWGLLLLPQAALPARASRCRQRCKLMCNARSRRRRRRGPQGGSSWSSSARDSSSQAGSRLPSSRGQLAAAAPGRRLRSSEQTGGRPRWLLSSAAVPRRSGRLLPPNGLPHRHQRRQQQREAEEPPQHTSQRQQHQRRHPSLLWRLPLGECWRRRQRRQRGAPGGPRLAARARRGSACSVVRGCTRVWLACGCAPTGGGAASQEEQPHILLGSGNDGRRIWGDTSGRPAQPLWLTLRGAPRSASGASAEGHASQAPHVRGARGFCKPCKQKKLVNFTSPAGTRSWWMTRSTGSWKRWQGRGAGRTRSLAEALRRRCCTVHALDLLSWLFFCVAARQTFR